MKSIKVKFKINTIEEEKEVADMTKGAIDFFKKENILFKWADERTIQQNYNERKYKDFLKKIKKRWKKEENKFVEKLIDFFKVEDINFTVKITSYGPMGFYQADKNQIILNLYNEKPVRTIKHEMVHIMVEPFIQKYSIDHNDKERSVNFITDFLDKS